MSHKTKRPADIFKPCYPPPEQPKQDVVDTGRTGKGAQGRRRASLQALTKENSLDAMQELIKLTSDTNPCVRFGAVRLLLKLCNGKVPTTHKHTGGAKRKGERLKVTIVRFKEEEKSGTARRHRTLPVVQGRREGSRDPGDGDGT